MLRFSFAVIRNCFFRLMIFSLVANLTRASRNRDSLRSDSRFILVGPAENSPLQELLYEIKMRL
jgi:hypothetical protein